MKPEQAKALREPFPPEAIGKLPKVTCKRCSDAPSRQCDTHRKSECRVCGNWITSAHLHLDYVGHAATSDRLLSVDPEWSWEPMAVDAAGLPLIVGGNLWIRLTVCGVTRLGVGDGKSAKECIGDAIRNAAMRFGVALDLWAKEDISNTTTYSDEEIAAAAAPHVERIHGRPATDDWANSPAPAMDATREAVGLPPKERKPLSDVQVVAMRAKSALLAANITVTTEARCTLVCEWLQRAPYVASLTELSPIELKRFLDGTRDDDMSGLVTTLCLQGLLVANAVAS